MDNTDYFSSFKRKLEDIEDVDLKKTKKKGRKKGVKSKDTLLWGNSYKKRVKQDKKINGLHHKLLKYPKDLNRSLSDMLEKEWVKELGITNMNDMFIFAVRQGFIYEKFNNE